MGKEKAVEEERRGLPLCVGRQSHHVKKAEFGKKMRRSLCSTKAKLTIAHGSIPNKSFLLFGELILESLFSKFRINVKTKCKEKQ